MNLTSQQVAASVVLILIFALVFAGWKWVGLPFWLALVIAVGAVAVNGWIATIEDRTN